MCRSALLATSAAAAKRGESQATVLQGLLHGVLNVLSKHVKHVGFPVAALMAQVGRRRHALHLCDSLLVKLRTHYPPRSSLMSSGFGIIWFLHLIALIPEVKDRHVCLTRIGKL